MLTKIHFQQLYVATCSPARDTGSDYVAWGHSTLVGPVSISFMSSFPLVEPFKCADYVIWYCMFYF
jgi:hypothetical protein